MLAWAYRSFYGLPPQIRARIVRLGVGTYTVGAVTLVRDADRRHLLLVRQPPGKGWSLPGGLLNRGERPAQGAARELAEETGLKLPPEAITPAVPNAIVHTRGRWIDLVFDGVADPATALHADEVEILEVGWHPVDNLPPVTPATARVLAHYGLGPLADYPEVTRP